MAERTTMDHEHAARREQLNREHAAAVSELAAVRRSPPWAVPAEHAASAAPGDEWAAVIQQFELRKRAAMVEVANASTEWQRARLSFFESRVELAASRLAVLRCSYEVERAHAVDRNLLGSDIYDSAPYRAQLAETQQGWYAAELRVKNARDVLTAASAKLTHKKAAYAELVRVGPQVPTSAGSRLTADRDEPVRASASSPAKRAMLPKQLEQKPAPRVAGK